MTEVKDTGPQETISFTKPRLLIVEGKDEMSFLFRLSVVCRATLPPLPTSRLSQEAEKVLFRVG